MDIYEGRNDEPKHGGLNMVVQYSVMRCFRKRQIVTVMTSTLKSGSGGIS